MGFICKNKERIRDEKEYKDLNKDKKRSKIYIYESHISYTWFIYIHTYQVTHIKSHISSSQQMTKKTISFESANVASKNIEVYLT